MFELLTVSVFIWLLVKSVALALRLSWGMAKIVASVLMILALPALIICVLFIGGLALIVPVVLVGIAFAIIKACD